LPVSFISANDPRRIQEPWLVWDDRANLQARNVPGLHALICGVSNYPNLPGPLQSGSAHGLGMRQLSASSMSAFLIVDWLIRAQQSGQLTLPLATCRVLLSPTPAELNRAPPIGGVGPDMRVLGVPGCTLAALKKAADFWRQDASLRPDASTLFYFSGHGVQRGRGDQVLLLEDFGSTSRVLEFGVDVQSLHRGMAPTPAKYPNIARTQFYFVDACRQLPDDLKPLQSPNTGYLFDVEVSGTDDRRAPVFYAAPPDAPAQALRNDQTLFATGLLRCLSGEAAVPPRDDGLQRESTHWHVTSQSLNRGLKTVLEELNQKWQANQKWTADGFGEDAVLCFLGGAPTVPVRLMIEPNAAVPTTQLRIADATSGALSFTFPNGGSPHPYQQRLPAGHYAVDAIASTAPYRNARRFCLFEPLGSRLWILKV
jgi:hypothetical protein